MIEIRTRYTGRKSVQLNTGSESYVQQQFKDDCDIHTIIDRFTRGLPYRVNSQTPVYGDFSDVQDFKEAQNLIARTTEFFETLPADLRARFGNSPASFLDFVNNPANEDEAIRLGILQKRSEETLTPSKPVGNTDPLTPVQEQPVADSGKKEVAP